MKPRTVSMTIRSALAACSTLVVSTMLPATAMAAATPGTVTAQRGQSLWKIARANHTTVSALEAANPTVNPANLLIGTRLQLPSTAYTVQPGDTLWLAARKFGVSLAALEAANPNANGWDLLVGTQLTLPTAKTSTAGNAVATNSTSSTAQYWMARIISAEARGESYNAQVGVGDVVWHREISAKYPDTVKSVVFQITNGHYQFTPVLNGSIYATPTASAVQAAAEVLQTHKDLVPGALVFYTPSKTPASSWVRTQPVIGSIGSMVFAK